MRCCLHGNLEALAKSAESGTLAINNKMERTLTSTSPARDRLLIAATEVVNEVGAGHLTLDRVAASAGVSKGGLLYHFATKRELIQAMIIEVVAGFTQNIEAKIAGRKGSPNIRLSAAIQAMKERTPSEKLQQRALLAASAEDPELLEPAKVALKKHFDEVRAEATEPNVALTVLLAVEGLRFLELFDLLPLKHSEVDSMLEKLGDMSAPEK